MENMTTISAHQQGIGLVEVMVALLLLAIAVLGFTSMQMTAVKATDESLLRTRALTVMRGGAETMRANPNGITAFVTALNGTNTSVSVDSKDIDKTSCTGAGSSSVCTVNQLATRDALALKEYATTNGMQIASQGCPGTAATSTVAVTSTTSATYATGQARQCLIVSWSSSTAPTMGSATAPTIACANSNGVYNSGARCFIVEAY